jgi:hypothetical protein
MKNPFTGVTLNDLKAACWELAVSTKDFLTLNWFPSYHELCERRNPYTQREENK